MDTLLGRREKLTLQMQVLSQDRRAQMQRLRRMRRSLARAWVLPRDILSAALVVYERCSWVAEPSVAFLHGVARRKRWPPRSDEDVEMLLEQAFLDFDIDELGQLQSLHDALDPTLKRRVHRHVNEWQVVLWGRGLNSDHGVAPSTASLLHKAREVPGVVPVSATGTTITGRPDNKARAWAGRFRKKWRARIGKVRLDSSVNPTERQAKVRGDVSFSLLCGVDFRSTFVECHARHLTACVYVSMPQQHA